MSEVPLEPSAELESSAEFERKFVSQYEAEARGTYVAKTDLHAGAMGLPALLAQAVTNVSPTVATITGFVFVAGSVGAQAPLVFLGAAVIVIITALVAVELAKAIPSAGGYYTWISHCLGARTGWMVSWVYQIFSPPVMGASLVYLGSLVHGELERNYHFNLPWWAFVIIISVPVFFCLYRGITLSAQALIVVTLFEIAILMVLAIWGLASPGKGGFSFEPFNPSHFSDFNAFFLAVIFTIFTYTGWEGAAPMAEESRNPRRYVSRAIMGSILFYVILFTLTAWGFVIGWGTDHASTIGASAEPVPLLLAHQYWHGAWILILLAMVNSGFAVSIASANVATRMWYAMGRHGAFPRPLGKVDAKSKVPVNAVHLQVVCTIIFGPIAALVVGVNKWFFFWGLTTTFLVAVIYIAANISAYVLYSRRLRHEFRLLPHVILPALSTAAILWLVYKTVNPFPASPYNWTLPCAAIWVAIGGVILFVMGRRGYNGWRAYAGREADEIPADEATRQAPLSAAVG